MWRDDVYESCVKRFKLVGKKEEWMFINIFIKIIIFDWGSVIFIMVFVKEVLIIR